MVSEDGWVERVEHVDRSDHQQHVAFVATGGNVDRGGQLGVGAGVVEDDLVALHDQIEGDAGRIAIRRILVHEVGEEILPVRNRADDPPRLGLGEIEQILDAFPEGVGAEAGDDLPHSRFRDVDRCQLRLHVAPVLLGHAHVRHDDVDQFPVQLALVAEPGRRQAQTLLVHLRELA